MKLEIRNLIMQKCPMKMQKKHEMDLVKTKGFFILPSELFENVRASAKDDENLNETLERFSVI